MNQHAHIAFLVKKLLDDQISSGELQQLCHYFNSKESSGEVDLWLNELWKSSTIQPDVAIDFETIKKKLDRKIRQSSRQAQDEQGKIYRFVRAFMRYAAVFLLAVVLSWLYYHNPEAPQNVQTTVAQHPEGNTEISVSYGSKTKIVLPDSSVVYLNSGSKLNYPPSFSDQRHVTLEGEGYFVVRADSLHPFFVHAADISIKALGTEFDVKAYPEEENITTVLVHGSVEILKKDRNEAIAGLTPGESVIYVKGAKEAKEKTSPTSVVPGDPQMLLREEAKIDVPVSWIRNQLVFDAEPFEKIAIQLDRWYNVKVDIRNNGLKKVKLTGRYDTESIEQVLHSLQLVEPFRYRMEKNRIIIE